MVKKTKYNLILDLDGTILQAINFPSWYYDESSRHLFPLVGISMPLLLNKKEIIKKPSIKPDILQVFFRPYLINFLDYCFKHFNVSIWTNSTEGYCIDILDYLEIKDKCKHIWFRAYKNKREKRIPNGPYLDVSNVKAFEYEELRTRKKIKIGMDYRDMYKPLHLLWQKTDSPFNQYNQNNTLIIDDLAEMFVQYPDNTILIPTWCHLNWSDNNLKIIIDQLEIYLNSNKRKNVRDLCQYINKSFRKDIWQDINGSSCQNNKYLPETYYAKSTTKKNQKLLLQHEKIGNQKQYANSKKKQKIKQQKQKKQEIKQK